MASNRLVFSHPESSTDFLAADHLIFFVGGGAFKGFIAKIGLLGNYHATKIVWWLINPKSEILKLICFDSAPHHSSYSVHSPFGVFLSTSKNVIASELYVFTSLAFLLDKWPTVLGEMVVKYEVRVRIHLRHSFSLVFKDSPPPPP